MVPRVGSPSRNVAANAALLKELDAMAKPLARAPVPKPKSLTPLPSLIADESRRQKQRSNAAQTRCIYGRKAQRKLAHPLEEERQFFDVWPANNRSALMALTHDSSAPANRSLGGTLLNGTMTSVASNTTFGGTLTGGGGGTTESVFARPQLLVAMEDAVRTELQRLTSRFPTFAHENPVNAPPEELLSPREWKSRMAAADVAASAPSSSPTRAHHEKRAAAGAASRLSLPDPDGGQLIVANDAARRVTGPAIASTCSDEDAFRVERVRVFSAAAKDFASQFKSYRRLLLWIVREFDAFAAYCHANVWSPDARDEFRRRVQHEEEQKQTAERVALQQRLVDATNEIAELKARYEKLERSTANSQQVIFEKERLIAAKDREIAEADEGRAGLLQRIHRLEKELWQQRNLMEGPEQRIAELSKTIKDLEDRVARANIVYEENNKEKAVLKARVERLEETLRERKKQSSQQVSKAELMAIKKREVDILEQNATLQGRLAKMQARLQETQEALATLKSDRVTTPRPQWALVDDLFPRAASTAQRVAIAAQEYRMMLDQKDAACVELAELKEMIGALPRSDDNADNEILVPQMLARWLPKRGLDTDVPAYLKGVGRVRNLRLPRDAVQGLCRVLWVEREATRITMPMEQFVSRFCTNHAPEGAEPDSFAYSFYHALHWYAYDPLIGFTRDLITGALDELVFRDLVGSVADLRAKMLSSDTARRDSVNANNAVLSKADAIASLMEYLPIKEEEEIKRLIINLSRDCPGKDVDLTALFGFNADEQRFSNFLEEFYAQFLDERALLLRQYQDAVQSCTVDDDGLLSPPDLARRLWMVDPELPAQVMDDLMASLFDVNVEALFPSVADDTGVKHSGVNGERVYGCDDTVTNDMRSIQQKIKGRVLRRFTQRSCVPAILERRERAMAARRQQELDEEAAHR